MYKETSARKIAAMKEKASLTVLGIESSCDETAAAVVRDGRRVLSSVINSQADIHKLYGGVVPEIASRNHIVNISPVVAAALKEADLELSDIDVVGVTYGAGLLGSLLVGLSFAKALAFAGDIPLVAVNHIEGHISAGFVETELKPPFLALVVSGGHTSLINVTDYTRFETLNSTCDDAAGEACDKAARVLGLPYPGGPNLDKLSKEGTANITFMKPRPVKDFKISYSGLKTSVINYIRNREQRKESFSKADVAASFIREAFDPLLEHTFFVMDKLGYKELLVCGGVAANSYLRENAVRMAKERGAKALFPPMELCGDNAVMIASSAYFNVRAGRNIGGLEQNAYSVLRF